MEPSIIAAASPPQLFTADILRFTEEAAECLADDFGCFREDHGSGAFTKVDMVYR
ncbi:hypothetical protein GTW51_21670 [Aurantimonas aggregata]|uniref:Uncharacterized protein n=1 Tax=Aurantimonas aggregata TaxID=2047720 RepID=A0A6L9MMV4_9HYPH|nr:hypothetical protein [Aurantimonas aggregata]NDV89274.1 hypothetical protein [Aurantimonas aggregata]